MHILTKSDIEIERNEKKLKDKEDIFFLIDYLNSNRGMFLSSGTEYPGRYSRWETGFYNPPVEVRAYFDRVIFEPLNKRGKVIVNIFQALFDTKENLSFKYKKESDALICYINFSDEIFPEEKRSFQPSVLSPIRELLDDFYNDTKDVLGFFGAFAFDLLFQFEKVKMINKRDEKQPLIRLFFPDKIYTFDRKKEEISSFEYDFSYKNFSTKTIAREGLVESNCGEIQVEGEIQSNLSDEKYASLVEKAKENMRRGDIFELVLRRKYFAQYKGSSSTLFKKMIEINPSPYQFFFQFLDEQLIGTSPEMFVRVTKNRVESCPISGTIKRGKNPIEDEKRIRELLNSKKDEVELTMCTDVDRNDKSRVCIPGSIRLLSRRQIEKYRGLFHTVDHVEGILRDDCTGIDAFLSHMWAVTLMGSPKINALRLIEEYENEPRDYYGGAIGAMFLNGNINTGITIRTIHLKDNIANYSVGASLVYDSDGFEEAKETKTKATSFFNIFNPKTNPSSYKIDSKIAKGLNIIVIDNEDSFVNTLSDYFRQTGASVLTYRHGVSVDLILSKKPDLIIHSPGPKLPKDFNMVELIKKLEKYNIPQFGVCLGLQGIAEACGAKLRQLKTPHQGKSWKITHTNSDIFSNLSNNVSVGAYHSWVADENCFPDCLKITAKTDEGLIMGIAHKDKPLWGVQFHPESIMSQEDDFGHKLIENVIRCVLNETNFK